MPSRVSAGVAPVLPVRGAGPLGPETPVPLVPPCEKLLSIAVPETPLWPGAGGTDSACSAGGDLTAKKRPTNATSPAASWIASAPLSESLRNSAASGPTEARVQSVSPGISTVGAATQPPSGADTSGCASWPTAVLRSCCSASGPAESSTCCPSLSSTAPPSFSAISCAKARSTGRASSSTDGTGRGTSTTAAAAA